MNPNHEEILARLERYDGFLKQDPANPSLAGEVADLHLRLGHIPEARQVLESALQHNPAPTLRSRLATVWIASNQPECAIDVIEELLRDGIDHPALRYNLAYALLLSKRAAEAKIHLDTIDDNHVDVPRAPVLRALTLHHLGDVEAAAKHVGDFLARYPDDADALGIAALIELDSEQGDRARELARRALAVDPNNTSALITSGSLALEEHDEANASAIFDRAIVRSPHNGRAWSGKGLATMLRLDLKAATEDLQQAVTYMPEHIGTWHALAWCQLLMDDYVNAEKSFDRSMEIDRTFGETHGGLAVVYVLQNRIAEAESAAKRAVRLDPQSFAGRFAQSLLLTKTDPAKAQETIRNIMNTGLAQDGTRLQDALTKALARMKKPVTHRISEN